MFTDNVHLDAREIRMFTDNVHLDAREIRMFTDNVHLDVWHRNRDVYRQCASWCLSGPCLYLDRWDPIMSVCLSHTDKYTKYSREQAYMPYLFESTGLRGEVCHTRFPAPFLQTLQELVSSLKGHSFLRAAVHRRCQRPTKGSGTNKTVETAQRRCTHD